MIQRWIIELLIRNVVLMQWSRRASCSVSSRKRKWKGKLLSQCYFFLSLLKNLLPLG